ncbi:MAG: nucleoside hydrolase [Spirochaetales bacterium]|uniref:Nucleoside hydrolase n=1 Tax=Candidatus Thalassospirochaeta sargassi TaxID=3119039 RepID=A0AAJ1IFB9_9SPIO|nr:nucleoside hydrolase [Spirochaetales bacterium]
MTKIILDCDPGHDDMMAIMLAAASDELELLGITTVAGNQTGSKTFENARKIITLLNLDVPLARGADKPIVRELITAPQIHGNSGLDGAELPGADAPYLGCHAVDFIIDSVKASKDKITLVPTGPLTNIGLALIKAPEIKKNIEQIVLMGGAVYDSNMTPGSEFNIFVDPEAAREVFLCGLPVTMVGLDVTNKSLMSFEQAEEMIGWGGRISSVVGPLMKFFGQSNLDYFGINGAPIHDALTVATLVNPDVVEFENWFVDIETQGELTRGQTVADVYRVTGNEPNCRVAMKVNNDLFMSIMMDAVKKLDGMVD